MIHANCPVLDVEQVADNVFVLSFVSPEISSQIQAGQFINIRVGTGTEPLLRRPFSVYRTDGRIVQIIFNVVGKGSTILRSKHAGDIIDVLGPLGVPFSLGNAAYETAILIGGGLGVAPLPISTMALQRFGKRVETFLGARHDNQLVQNHLVNVHLATDDGSKGFHGDVVSLLRTVYDGLKDSRPMIFACGPTKMLQAAAAFAREKNVPCEVSLEGQMACGFGICQGCPVQLSGTDRKYALMCKDGPTFNISKIVI